MGAVTDLFRGNGRISSVKSELLVFIIAGGAEGAQSAGCKEAAREGGDVAGKARNDLESRTGKRVVSRRNYLEGFKSRKALPAKNGR